VRRDAGLGEHLALEVGVVRDGDHAVRPHQAGEVLRLLLPRRRGRDVGIGDVMNRRGLGRDRDRRLHQAGVEVLAAGAEPRRGDLDRGPLDDVRVLRLAVGGFEVDDARRLRSCWVLPHL
jgi:hypothetical protein